MAPTLSVVMYVDGDIPIFCEPHSEGKERTRACCVVYV